MTRTIPGTEPAVVPDFCPCVMCAGARLEALDASGTHDDADCGSGHCHAYLPMDDDDFYGCYCKCHLAPEIPLPNAFYADEPVIQETMLLSACLLGVMIALAIVAGCVAWVWRHELIEFAGRLL